MLGRSISLGIPRKLWCLGEVSIYTVKAPFARQAWKREEIKGKVTKTGKKHSGVWLGVVVEGAQKPLFLAWEVGVVAGG